MNPSTAFAVATCLLGALGCSSKGSDAPGASPGSASTASGSGSSSVQSADDGGPTDGSPGDGGESPWDGAAIATIVMPRISGSAYSGVDGGVPAFSSDPASNPSNANDNLQTTGWAPSALPAWIAYDLSMVPVSLRQTALVVWNAQRAAGYINTSPPSGGLMPTAYTVEINDAPGGTAAPPTAGWTQVVSVTDNLRDTVEHPITMNGANWLRMTVTAASDPTVFMDLDVFATPNGASDCWMFMGDSITFITMPYVFSDLPQLVNQAKSSRWPAAINAALGGTNTVTAVSVIDSTMAGYPGRYVVLAYGTNDLPSDFQMESLVQSVLAAGKIPVVPLMPWSSEANIQTNGPLINAAIQALYVKYPQIVPGPDLWTAFMNRTDLIPDGDVHPNVAGEEFLRQQWAQTISAIP